MFQTLIGEKAATHFIPRVVVDPSKNREDRERFLIDPNTVKSWIFTECVICNNSSEIPESVSSCKKIIEEGLFVCPFHYLFGGLAENVIVRQTSFSDLFVKQYEKFEQGEKEVSHILRFDGNSIGLNFKRDSKNSIHQNTILIQKYGKMNETKFWISNLNGICQNKIII